MNLIKKFQKIFNKPIFTLKYYDDYHRASIVRLVVILIITIYVGNNFKLNKKLLNVIDSHKIFRLFAVYALCLTYVTSNDNNIAIELVNRLGHPFMTTSLHDEDEIIDYMTDPELIYEKYDHQVDHVIDGGFGNNEASTVVDCTGDEIEIIRQGIGELVF